MTWLQVDENKTNFTLDGKPFFYLADTIWSAFTNVTEEEWEYYLKRRKEQGFNVLQVNTMPQWDRCMSDIGIYPFATEDGQIFDFTKWNQEYYEHAKQMCQKAVDMGFQLALVVLWLNYVPGTWGSKIMDKNVMPEAFVKEYVEKIVLEFIQFILSAGIRILIHQKQSHIIEQHWIQYVKKVHVHLKVCTLSEAMM